VSDFFQLLSLALGEHWLSVLVAIIYVRMFNSYWYHKKQAAKVSLRIDRLRLLQEQLKSQVSCQPENQLAEKENDEQRVKIERNLTAITDASRAARDAIREEVLLRKEAEGREERRSKNEGDEDQVILDNLKKEIFSKAPLGVELVNWYPDQLKLELEKSYERLSEHELKSGFFRQKHIASYESLTAKSGHKFHFRFEGDGSRGNTLIRGRNVQLIFDQGSSSAIQSIVFWGEKFLPLMESKEARLTITIWPTEGIEVLSSEITIAAFKKSKLINQPMFDLYVDEECPDKISFTVEFFAYGTKLYALSFTKKVNNVNEDTSEIEKARNTKEFDLDMLDGLRGAKEPKISSNDLLLKLHLLHSGLMISIAHYNEDGVAYIKDALIAELDKDRLQACLTQIRMELGADFYASDVWETVDFSSLNDLKAKDLIDCFERVASAGNILYTALASNVEAVKILNHINSQPVGTRLTIATSQVFLPLEIMYPHAFSIDWSEDQRKLSPVKREDFWGFRFAIEILLAGDGDYSSLIKIHKEASPLVSMNINSNIHTLQDPSPEEIHSRLESHLKERGIDCIISNKCEEMKKILLGAGTAAKVVYVYCHGSAADPQQGRLEELQLDTECAVRPSSMYPNTYYSSAPIVFLNACCSSATSPLFFNGFLNSFSKQGALGLVATSFPVPIMFGAYFGSQFVSDCLLGEGSLGERMRRLRVSYARDGNPVPLFYSVQCQLN
jgi:hypothetical protein